MAFRLVRTPKIARLAVIAAFVAVVLLLLLLLPGSSSLTPAAAAAYIPSGSTFARVRPAAAAAPATPKLQIDARTSPPLPPPEQVELAEKVYAYKGKTLNADFDSKAFGLPAPMYAVVTHAGGWPLIAKWLGSTNAKLASMLRLQNQDIADPASSSSSQAYVDAAIIEVAPSFSSLKPVGTGSTINGRTYYTNQDVEQGLNGRYLKDKQQILRREKGYHALWGDGVMRRLAEQKHQDSLDDAEYDGTKPSNFNADDKAFAALDEVVVWSRFAYAQYVSNVVYLCNSLMVFQQLHELNVRADRLLLYPSTWDEPGFFDKNSTKQTADSSGFEEKDVAHHVEYLLKTAALNYGVSLQPVPVPDPEANDFAYTQSYMKYAMFNQTQYDRILYLDSDGSVSRSLDHLFLLPRATAAATKAYWKSTKDDLPDFKADEDLSAYAPQTSTAYLLNPQLALIEPSADVFAYAVRHLNTPEAQATLREDDDYDLQIFNQIFRDEAMLIPHRLTLVSSEDLRSQDYAREQYLNRFETWDAKAVLAETAYLHFSDATHPKPWIKASRKDIRANTPVCASGTIVCPETDIWLHLYRNYALRRADICKMPLMLYDKASGRYSPEPEPYNRNGEFLKKQAEDEARRRREEEEKKKQEEEKKKQEEVEKKKKQEDAAAKEAADKKKKQEEAERKKKEDEDKARTDEERKKRREQIAKRLEERRRQREQAAVSKASDAPAAAPAAATPVAASAPSPAPAAASPSAAKS